MSLDSDKFFVEFVEIVLADLASQLNQIGGRCLIVA